MKDQTRAAVGFLGVAGVTIAYTRVLGVANSTTVALTYLMVVLLVAATSRFWSAAVVSVVAVFSLNFFFLPPVGTLRIAEPENWVALGAFLAVSLVSSNLASAVRARAREALARQDALGRLFDVSRDILLLTDGREGLSPLVESLARRFGFSSVSVCLAHGSTWTIFEAGPNPIGLEPDSMSGALARLTLPLASDQQRAEAGRRTLRVNGRQPQVVPLRVGAETIGQLVVDGAIVEGNTLDALAGVVAMAVERVESLEARKAAELTKQSEELKTALLASIGHDLRTPLTTIRVAASNLQSSWLSADERTEQSGLVLAEVERLNRLFQNILDLARIDAGAVAPDTRWIHAAEIVGAARDIVSKELRGHAVTVSLADDVVADVDPRLTAAALSHLLENAAQYSAEGTPIEVAVVVAEDELTFSVRDHGPGIAPADLPHLFDRFYRGEVAAGRPHGIGMGLAIARGLVAAEHGRIWAENCPDGGARFGLSLMVATRQPAISAGSQ